MAIKKRKKTESLFTTMRKDVTLPPPKRWLSYRIGNLQGIGKRETQQDAFCFSNSMDVMEIIENGILAAVADGMGGMAGGQLASKIVIDTLLSDFQKMDRQGDLAKQLENSVLHCNKLVNAKLHQEGGSTAVAVILYHDWLYYTSVGDSSLILKRGDALIRMNRKQNKQSRIWMDTIIAGDMDPTDGNTAEKRKGLTHFIGMNKLKDLDSLKRPFKLHEGDVLLLCSDGIGEVLTDEEIYKYLRDDDPYEVCHNLELAVMRHNVKHQDNYTALVIRCC